MFSWHAYIHTVPCACAHCLSSLLYSCVETSALSNVKTFFSCLLRAKIQGLTIVSIQSVSRKHWKGLITAQLHLPLPEAHESHLTQRSRTLPVSSLTWGQVWVSKSSSKLFVLLTSALLSRVLILIFSALKYSNLSSKKQIIYLWKRFKVIRWW